MDACKGLIYGDYYACRPRATFPASSPGRHHLGTSRQPFKMMRVPGRKRSGQGRGHEAELLQAPRLDCWSSSAAKQHPKTANLCARKASTSSTCPRPSTTASGTEAPSGRAPWNRHSKPSIHIHRRIHNRVFIVDHGPQGRLADAARGHRQRRGHHPVPEIPYDIDKVIEAIQHRTKQARVTITSPWPRRHLKRFRPFQKDLKEKQADYKYPSVSTGSPRRSLADRHRDPRHRAGHMQRGGSLPVRPCSPPRLGAEAANLILDGGGYMVGTSTLRSKQIAAGGGLAGKLKVVSRTISSSSTPSSSASASYLTVKAGGVCSCFVLSICVSAPSRNLLAHQDICARELRYEYGSNCADTKVRPGGFVWRRLTPKTELSWLKLNRAIAGVAPIGAAHDQPGRHISSAIFRRVLHGARGQPLRCPRFGDDQIDKLASACPRSS